VGREYLNEPEDEDIKQGSHFVECSRNQTSYRQTPTGNLWIVPAMKENFSRGQKNEGKKEKKWQIEITTTSEVNFHSCIKQVYRFPVYNTCILK